MGVQYLSQQKYNQLKEELADIRQNKKPETAKRIDEARQMGDLKENAEYQAAREHMSWLESRAKEIDAILSHAEIVDQTVHSDAVIIGSTVVVEVQGKEKTYMIVGAQEANPLEGKISNESPIGHALVGKKKGETVIVDLPAGKQSYIIKDVR